MWTYEFYALMARTIFHSFATFTLLPREHKIRIFELTNDFLDVQCICLQVQYQDDCFAVTSPPLHSGKMPFQNKTGFVCRKPGGISFRYRLNPVIGGGPGQQTNKWVVPEKIHIPPTDGILEILTGGGVKYSGNPGGRGG